MKKDKNVQPKKINEAVALKYDPGNDNAPKIVAIGKGELADRIIKKAKENNVAVYKDKILTQTLTKLNLGDEIPRELYAVVAEVLIFISSIDEKYGEKYGRY